MKVKQ